MNTALLMIRYHEIALKGGKRPVFEKQLARNIDKMLKRTFGSDAPIKVLRQTGRILVEAPWDDENQAKAQQTLEKVFGISSFSPMRKVDTHIETIKTAALEEFQKAIAAHGMPKTFRVQTRRSDKVFPESSTDLDRIFGSHLHAAFPDLQVELKKPELRLGIEIRRNQSYIWSQKFPGPGGLPVGSNGKLLALMSGGIDSPIAVLQILKRGSPVRFIHFDGAPFVGPESREKAEDLVRLVNQYQPAPERMHTIAFGKIQEKIALVTDAKMRTVLYRRMMMRISCRIARRIKALALVTGEALGQVASQTLENLVTIDRVSDLPILRPLIAYDKSEIIALAHHFKTFDTSVREAADCCTLFGDRHPTIYSTPAEAEEQEKNFDVEALVNEACEKIESWTFQDSRHNS